MNDTRNELLEAARICVARHGLAATTSRMITAEADANLAAITYHFGSKEQLVADALLDGLRTWLAPALDVLRGDDDPSVRTVAAVSQLVAAFTEHADAAPTYLQSLAAAPQSPPLRDGLVALLAEVRDVLAGDVAALVKRGEVGPWADPVAMAGAIVAAATGMATLAAVDPDGPAVPAMAAQLASLLLAARRPAHRGP